MAETHSPLAEPVSFLSLPYEIRHMIYGSLIPTKHEIYITDPEPVHIAISEESIDTRFVLRKEHTSLLLSCRAINEDITTLFYGSNIFIFGSGYCKWQRGDLYTSSDRCEQFLTHLRPSTALKCRDVRLFLGQDHSYSLVNHLDPTIGSFPNLSVGVCRAGNVCRPPRQFGGNFRSWYLTKKACKIIAEARSGKDTLWILLEGEKAVEKMLDSIMPEGYDYLPQHTFEDNKKVEERSATFQRTLGEIPIGELV